MNIPAPAFLENYKQKPHQSLLLALVVLGLALRLFQISEWSFWHDEALTVLLAQKPVPELIAVTAADVHPPLYYVVVKIFFLAGRNELIARLPSALFGAGSVAALYLLGRTLFDEKVGLAAGFILALSPLHLFYAQEARMYSQLVFLTILTAWFLFRAWPENHKIWWGAFILSATLAAYTAYFAFPALAAMGVYVLLVDRRRERIFYFLAASGLVLLLYLPWLNIFLAQTRAVAGSYWLEPPHPLLLFTTVSAFFTGYTLPAWGIAVSLGAALFIIFTALNSARHALKKQVDGQALLWLLAWGLVPLLTTFLISLWLMPIFQLRTVITAAPAFYLLVAWALVRAPYSQFNLLLFLPLLAMMGVSILNFYFNPAFAKPAWREAAFYLQERTRAGDVVLHTSPGSFLTFLAYESDQGGVDHILLPDPAEARQNAPSQPIIAAVGGLPQPVEAVVSDYDRMWLVVGLDQSIEYQTRQKQRFDENYRLLEENEVGGIYISAYTVEP